VVYLVANADQLRATGQGLELGNRLDRMGIREVDPSDHPREEVRDGGGRQQVAGFVQARAGLDHDAAVHAAPAELRREVHRAERPSNLRELVRHPWIGGARGIPEVMMRVDNHGRLDDGTGAVSRSKPSVLSADQRSGGSSSSKSSMFSWGSATDRQPVRTQATAGWARGNCKAAAFAGTLKLLQTPSIRCARSTISAAAGS